MIANEGSGGASNSSYSYFVFDGSKLQLAESVIYDGAKDPENPWFYSTVSQYDAENAAPISEEAATELMEKYVYTNPPLPTWLVARGNKRMLLKVEINCFFQC